VIGKIPLCIILVIQGIVPLWSLAVVGISSKPELFLDDYIIDGNVNMCRKIQKPEKHISNPLFGKEFAWEQRTVQMYGTVNYDPVSMKFRGWYLASESSAGNPEYYICYAESGDGIHWEKPMVGPGVFGPYTEHNVVIRGGHGIGIVDDPCDTDPLRRYKGAGGSLLGFSPDGINWTTMTWAGIGKNDTGTSVIGWKGQYLAFVRNQGYWENGVMREVALTTSTDFETWSAKQTFFRTDAADGYPWVQPYGLSVTVYGDQLIGLLWLLHLDEVPGNNSIGDMDVQLVTSRDGQNWSRVADRQVFMEPTAGTWDEGRIFPSTTLVVKDDLVYIYYTGSDTRHGISYGNVGIGLATLPADRFVALTPEDPTEEGILETVLLTTRGHDLLVNAGIDPGELLVEVLAENGTVMAGFDRDHCRLSVQDSLRYRVFWQEGERTLSLSDLVNMHFSLRFVLSGDGKLYSFQTTPVPVIPVPAIGFDGLHPGLDVPLDLNSNPVVYGRRTVNTGTWTFDGASAKVTSPTVNYNSTLRYATTLKNDAATTTPMPADTDWGFELTYKHTGGFNGGVPWFARYTASDNSFDYRIISLWQVSTSSWSIKVGDGSGGWVDAVTGLNLGAIFHKFTTHYKAANQRMDIYVDDVLMAENVALGHGQYTLNLVQLEDADAVGTDSYGYVKMGQINLTVQGTVTLNGFAGDNTTVPIFIEIRDVDNTTALETHTVTLATDGSYSFATALNSLHDVSAQAAQRQWLRQTQKSVNLPGTTTVNFSMFGGDFDGDGEITSMDVSILLANMDMQADL